MDFELYYYQRITLFPIPYSVCSHTSRVYIYQMSSGVIHDDTSTDQVGSFT